MRFIWIDDEPKREDAAKNLATALGVEVVFYGVNKKKVEDDVKTILAGEEPDLLILDHFLNQASSEVFKTGSTLAFYIHEQWPSCPIISVTNAEEHEIEIRHREAYEEIFQGSKISYNYQKILSIAEGFKEFKNANINSIDDLLILLDYPDSEKNKIKKILPTEIKENILDKSLSLEFYRWMNTVFLERPGFIYNHLWAATYLGLSKKGFESIKDKFEGARYYGIFYREEKELWWKCELGRILGEYVEDVGTPWVIGRSLVDADEEYYSKCEKSKEEFPEIVAASDDSSEGKWYPVKLKYTETHPNFEDLLFFEEMRVMKAD